MEFYYLVNDISGCQQDTDMEIRPVALFDTREQAEAFMSERTAQIPAYNQRLEELFDAYTADLRETAGQGSGILYLAQQDLESVRMRHPEYMQMPPWDSCEVIGPIPLKR